MRLRDTISRVHHLQVGKEHLEVSLLAKAYYCSPLWTGTWPTEERIRERLMTYGPINEHSIKNLREFIARWGIKCPKRFVPRYVKGLTAYGLAIILHYHEASGRLIPVKASGCEQYLSDMLLEHLMYNYHPKVFEILYFLSRYQNKPMVSQKVIRDRIKAYNLCLQDLEHTGLIVVQDGKCTWPDPPIRQALERLDMRKVEWLGMEYYLSRRGQPQSSPG